MTRLRRRIAALFRRARFERDMDEEMRVHLELEIEERIRGGMSPAEARRTALRDFGGLQRMKERARDTRGLRPFDALSQDLRFGLRVIGRRPAFAVLAVLTLAVGIGAPTAVFSLANAVLLRPVPGVNAPEERLLQLRFRGSGRTGSETGISYPNLLELRTADMPAVREIAAETNFGRLHVAVPGGATTLLDGPGIIGDYFGALGVRPSAGRLIEGGETLVGTAQPVAVVSEQARDRLFGDEDPVGRELLVNGVSFSVIGVAGGGFRGITRTGDSDLWLPFGVGHRLLHTDPDYAWDRGSSHSRELLVLLEEGASPEAAEAQLGAATDALVEAYPDEASRFADYRPTLFADIGISPWVAETTRKTMYILLATVCLVLVVACANVSNLLIFRGVRRQGESAVRQAMGASRPRLLRQHLTETGLLAAGGVALGVGLAIGLLRLFEGLGLGGRVAFESVTVDVRVLLFAALAGAASLLLAGLLPGLVVNRVDLVPALKEAAPTETGRKARLRAALTVVQISLSLALLVGALLAARTVRGLQAIEVGFEPEGLVSVTLDPDPQGYDEDRANAFQRALLAEAARLPMARSVAAVGSGPFGAHFYLDLRPQGAAEDGWPVNAYGDFVTPGYFDALGVRMLRGRTFSPDELEASFAKASDVAILNETLALRAFGTLDVLGRTMVQRGYRANTTLRVVGVVADSRLRAPLEAPQEPALYRPLGEHYSNVFSLLIRSSAPAATVIDGVRALVDRLDPALPFYRARSLEELVAGLVVEERFLARLMSVLAILAGLLAAVGLYGVVAYSVAERTREIGIRLALGAGAGRVITMVLRQSLLLAVIGVAVGAGFAYLLARALESRLYGVAPLDPVTWTAAAGAFILVALVAAAGPIRLAVRIEPTRALRS